MASGDRPRLRLSEALWQTLKAMPSHLWRRSVPFFVGLSGLALGCMAVLDPRESATQVGLFLAAFVILWALGLAYERGHAAGSAVWGNHIALMIAGDSETTLTVVHEHRASPEALAIIRAEAALAQRDGGREGRA